MGPPLSRSPLRGSLAGAGPGGLSDLGPSVLGMAGRGSHSKGTLWATSLPRAAPPVLQRSCDSRQPPLVILGAFNILNIVTLRQHARRTVRSRQPDIRCCRSPAAGVRVPHAAPGGHPALAQGASCWPPCCHLPQRCSPSHQTLGAQKLPQGHLGRS